MRLALAAAGMLIVARGAIASDVAVAVTDASGAPLGDAVAYLVSKSGAALSASAPKATEVDQVNKMFSPDVSVVQTGTPVHFPNSDNIRHHVYSFSPAKVFDLKLYSGRPSSPVIFDKPGVVTLGCNIHDQMVAWILVVDTPLYAKSNAQGKASIPNVSDGEYDLRVWHPGMNADLSVPVKVEGVTATRRVVVKATSIAELRRELAATGAR